MDPIIGGAIIGGVGNLIGNLFGKSSTDKANETNMKIAQMNNEFNERMMQKQMDYNTLMWDKQNEYNTAANQRKRLEEAGLNPYMMMSGGSAGMASNAGSVSAAQSANNPTVQAFHPDFSGLSESITSALQLEQQRDLNKAQIDNINAQTNSINIENQYKADMILKNMDKTVSETNKNNSTSDLTKTQKDLAEKDLKFYDFRLFMDVNEQIRQMYILDQQATGIAIDNMCKWESLQVLPQQLRANLAETVSRIKLNDANAEKAVQDAIVSIYKQTGIAISNENAAKMSKDIIREAKAKADEAESNAKKVGAESDYKASTFGEIGMFLSDFGGFLGGAIGKIFK